MVRERGVRHFRSKEAYRKSEAFIHMHVHKGPSKHPYQVRIRGKRHHVVHATPHHSRKPRHMVQTKMRGGVGRVRV